VTSQALFTYLTPYTPFSKWGIFAAILRREIRGFSKNIHVGGRTEIYEPAPEIPHLLPEGMPRITRKQAHNKKEENLKITPV
jgi:hypothetical protein